VSFLAWQPKARRLCLHRCCSCPCPAREQDHHYYHLSFSLGLHRRWRRRQLESKTSQQQKARHQRRRSPHALLFFIGVVEDDHLAIIGRPEDVVVEVTEQLSGEVLVPRGISNEIFFIRRRREINHRNVPGGTTLLKHQ
jgi:hypothetical protein